MALKSPKETLTEDRVDRYPAPAKGKKIYYDDKTQGFCLIVTKAGTKTFYVYRKVNGRPEQIRLGRWSNHFPVAQARKRAGEINNQIDSGENPNDIRREKRLELTLGEFFEVYFEQHSKMHHKRPRDSRSRFENNLSKFRNRTLSSLDRMDVQTQLTALARSKSESSANEATKLLRALYNKAIDWGYFKGENPTKKVKLFREVSRERFLLPEELARFMDAVQQEPNETNRDFILMALFTGARRGNLQEMAWRDISFQNQIWVIPETKNGTPLIVPLVEPGLRILARREKSRDSAWVFPGPGRTGHLVEIKKAFTRIMNNAGIEDFRFHDLRRTHGSYMAMSGANTFAIQKALGHKDIKSTTVYARMFDAPVRDGMNSGVLMMQDYFSKDEL